MLWNQSHYEWCHYTYIFKLRRVTDQQFTKSEHRVE